MKFHKIISNEFQLTERTRVHSRNGYTRRNGYIPRSKGNYSRTGKPKVMLDPSASRFIMLYICVKFRENISDCIIVMKRSQMSKVLTNGRTLKILEGIT